MLSTSNNHAFDQGLGGVAATLEAPAKRGLIAVGTGETGTTDALRVIEVAGLRIGFAAYTISPNTYADADGEVDYWTRDCPVHEPTFNDWMDDYRAEGVAVFDAHARRSEAEAADLLVALVVGGHSHVLNPPELYRGRPIAYSMGNFISDFAQLETPTGAVLQVTVGMNSASEAEIIDFAYTPVLTARDGHVVIPLGAGLAGDQADAWALARRGRGALPRWGGSQCDVRTARRHGWTGPDCGSTPLTDSIPCVPRK